MKCWLLGEQLIDEQTNKSKRGTYLVIKDYTQYEDLSESNPLALKSGMNIYIPGTRFTVGYDQAFILPQVTMEEDEKIYKKRFKENEEEKRIKIQPSKNKKKIQKLKEISLKKKRNEMKKKEKEGEFETIKKIKKYK